MSKKMKDPNTGAILDVIDESVEKFASAGYELVVKKRGSKKDEHTKEEQTEEEQTEKEQTEKEQTEEASD